MMSASSEETMKRTGTTTVGLAAKDAVVLGAERRATMGHLIAHKNTLKVFRIDDNLGMTIAGLVGDAQVLVRYLRAEIELLRLKRGRAASVRAAANLLSSILHGARYSPYYVGLILGGFDREGPGVYSLDAAGGAIPDEYVSVGSGSPFAYGVLEDRFRKEMETGDAVDVAILALRAAQARDSASGDGYSIAVVDAGGYRELGGEEITSRLDKAGALSSASRRRRD